MDFGTYFSTSLAKCDDSVGVVMNMEDNLGMTLLSRLPKSGHEAVAKTLLDTGKVAVVLKDVYSQTPRSLAAEYKRRR